MFSSLPKEFKQAKGVGGNSLGRVGKKVKAYH